MASLSDILTVSRQVVQAINALAQTYLSVQGGQNLAALTTTTLVKATAGRVVEIAVTTAGTTAGQVYDDGNTTTPLRNLVAVIPTAVGVYQFNLPMNYGIVIVPGTGMVCTVSYS
jgi:N-acetylglucosamine kinase-like BadF-type ATPase